MRTRNRGIAVFAALALAITLAMPVSVSAAQTVRGSVLYTNITAYINNQQLPYYLLDTEYAYVALTDLTNYGFDILTNPQGKTASLTFNSSKLPSAIPAVEQVGKTGERAYSYWSTDWKVYINGKNAKYNVFNIAGRLSVDMRELDVFGKRVYDDATRTVKLTTAASAPSAPIQNQPSAPASSYYVTGYVYNGSGQAVNGATVTLSGAGANKTYTTSSNGAYTITGVAAGSNVTVTASAAGYNPVSSEAFVVNANVSGKDLRFAGGTAITVSGVVKAQNGATVANATLKLVNASGSVTNTATSAANGTYSFTNVAAGTYTIQAVATGYGTTNVPSFSVLTTSITRDVTLGVAASSITGSVVIPSGSYIQPSSVFVRIIDETGASYSDSQYVSFPSDYDTNNASNQFTLMLNKSYTGTKSFRVAVQFQYRLSSESTYNRTGTAASSAVSIPSNSMQNYNAGQVSLNSVSSATYTVSGLVGGLAANERARVYIEPVSGSSYRNNFLTDYGYNGYQSNSYTFTGVPNGTYRIYATVDGTNTTIATLNNVVVNGANVTTANLTANTGYNVNITANLRRPLRADVASVRFNLISSAQGIYNEYATAGYSSDYGSLTASFGGVPSGTYYVVFYGYDSSGVAVETVTLVPTSFTINSSSNIPLDLY